MTVVKASTHRISLNMHASINPIHTIDAYTNNDTFFNSLERFVVYFRCRQGIHVKLFPTVPQRKTSIVSTCLIYILFKCAGKMNFSKNGKPELWDSIPVVLVSLFEKYISSLSHTD